MTTWAVLSAGQVAYLVAVLVVAATVGVVLLMAVAAGEARSRRGEAERVAAIRQTLRTRQPAGRLGGGRS